MSRCCDHHPQLWTVHLDDHWPFRHRETNVNIWSPIYKWHLINYDYYLCFSFKCYIQNLFCQNQSEKSLFFLSNSDKWTIIVVLTDEKRRPTNKVFWTADWKIKAAVSEVAPHCSSGDGETYLTKQNKTKQACKPKSYVSVTLYHSLRDEPNKTKQNKLSSRKDTCVWNYHSLAEVAQ